MGLFDIFKKKECDICGGEIGFLGNKKLEDGDMCKSCAKKLSVWFDDRRHTTVALIKEQLQYREANKQQVMDFNTDRTFGTDRKILYADTNAQKFMIADKKGDLNEENPDVVSFSQVTAVNIDVKERSQEVTQQVKAEDGSIKQVSYSPRRWLYRFEFDVIIRVNHPYFDEMHFRLNDNTVQVEYVEQGLLERAIFKSFSPHENPMYSHYTEIADELTELLINRSGGADPQKTDEKENAVQNDDGESDADALSGPWKCGACDGENDGGKFCEYCGTPRIPY